MDYQQILKELKSEKYVPVYFFYGEEPFYIDKLISFMEENIIDDEQADFGKTILYGRDTNIEQIIFSAREYSMFGGYKLIIVKEAQDLKTLESLEQYIKSPTPSTILVFGYKYKSLDKRKTLYKLLNKSNDSVVFESKKLYDNQLPGWIEKWVLGMGYTIEPRAVMLLADHLGNDLSRIDNELQKLTVFLKPGEKITVDIVENNIGISKEFNAFELTAALGKKDAYKAMRIVNYFEANPKQGPLQLLSPTLFNYFIKILLTHKNANLSNGDLAKVIGGAPYFVNEYRNAAKLYPLKQIPEILSMIKKLDMKSKGIDSSDSTGYGFLKELILKLCA